jgi:hypothetical protein
LFTTNSIELIEQLNLNTETFIFIWNDVGAGMATAAYFTEITLHDCNMQRGIWLTEYYKSLGVDQDSDVEHASNPNRERAVNWNVKRKYVD